MMRKMRSWLSSRVIILVGAAALLALFSGLTMAQSQGQDPKGKESKGKGTVQSQQVCPPVSPTGKAQCLVQVDCRPSQPPGKAVCEVKIDCPPPSEKK
jgi:hypothetical protein